MCRCKGNDYAGVDAHTSQAGNKGGVAVSLPQVSIIH